MKIKQAVGSSLILLSLSGISSAAEVKKQTVGDLLKSADRGSGLQFKEKSKTALPEVAGDAVPGRAKPTVDLRQVKPPKTSSFLENGNDDKAKLEKITDEQIRELYKLTQKFKTSPQRGELWLRLAELYVEKASVIEFRKQSELDIKLRDFQAGKTQVRPKLDLTDAREYNKRAIQLYDWFVRDFPRDPKMDQALFFLGYNNYELGDAKKGTFYYDRLTKEHPGSPFVMEAHFALGEFYFENEKWKDAETHYASVLTRPKHRLYGFSLYKSAWCQFRTGRAAEALKSMELLIRSGKQAAAEGGSGKRNFNKNRLESEGLRDIVLFYTEVGEAERAPSYFKGLAGDEAAIGYLEKLAYFYGDKGQIESARFLFKYLITNNPTSAKAFEYKFQVVQLYSNAKKSKEFREELYAWIRDFGVGSSWYQTNKNNKELIDNSYKLREHTLRIYTLQQHQAAQNSHAPFSQGLALEGYRLYLGEFTTSPMIADMHFYYAELLYDMNRFDEAGVQYRWVVENAPQSKFFGKAADAVILSLERDVPKDAEISKRVGKSLEPVSFEAKVDRFVVASTWYVGKFPTSEKTPEVKFRVGRLYYQHNQFDQAIPVFRDIVQKYPNTKFAEYSANLLLDIYNLRKDYTGLEKIAGELLAVPGIAKSKAGADIKGVLDKATFKRAQDLEIAKDYAGSAQQFEAFSKANIGTPLATTALFNAAINYERAGQNGSAISSHVAVLNSKEKESAAFKPKSRRILGKLYQDAGMLDEAAVTFKAAAIELGNDPLVPNLHFNAAVLSEALGRNDEALKEYQTSYDKNKKADRIETVFQMANLYRRQGSLTKAVEKYKEYVAGAGTQPDRVVESAYWAYEISTELKRRKDSDEWKQKTLSIQKRFAPNKRGVGAQYAAKIAFKETLNLFDSLKAVQIPSNPKRQQAAAQQKISMITKLNHELAEVIRFDSPEEIVGALSVLGQANLHMGEALVNAPLPAGLNAEESKQYKAGIEKIAEPFFGKAKDSLKAAVDRGSELDAYTAYYDKAKELLAKLDPKSAVDTGEITLDSRQSAWIGL